MADASSPAEAQVLGEGGLDLVDPLRVAKSDCGLGPSIVPKGGDASGEGVEQGRIDRHVGRGIAKGVGQ